MANKTKYVCELQLATNRLAKAINDIQEFPDLFFDKQFNSGGDNEIVDGDIAGLGITAAELTAVITAIQQLLNYRDNSAVATADYGASFNKLRTDR